MYVLICTCECRCPRSPKKDVRSLEPFDMGAGNQLRSWERAESTLAKLSPRPHIWFFETGSYVVQAVLELLSPPSPLLKAWDCLCTPPCPSGLVFCFALLFDGASCWFWVVLLFTFFLLICLCHMVYVCESGHVHSRACVRGLLGGRSPFPHRILRFKLRLSGLYHSTFTHWA